MQSFLKNRKRSRTSFPATFSAWFLKKNIYFVIFFYLPWISLPGCFTSEDIEQYVYCICFLGMLWRHKLWNKPNLSNQGIFSTWPKSRNKNLNILRTKRIFKTKKAFSSFLKSFHWNKNCFLRVKWFLTLVINSKIRWSYLKNCLKAYKRLRMLHG